MCPAEWQPHQLSFKVCSTRKLDSRHLSARLPGPRPTPVVRQVYKGGVVLFGAVKVYEELLLPDPDLSEDLGAIKILLQKRERLRPPTHFQVRACVQNPKP